MKLPTYGLTPPKNYNSKKQVFGHTIFLKKEDTHIVPNSFNNKSLGPDNFLDLKREIGLISILITDRIKPAKKKLCIMNHVNRSGYNFLIGKTPTQGLPRFPDMSNIYNKIRGLDTVVVHTIGPERFDSAEPGDVFLSESVGLIAPVWHYVGVRVFAKTIENQD